LLELRTLDRRLDDRQTHNLERMHRPRQLDIIRMLELVASIPTPVTTSRPALDVDPTDAWLIERTLGRILSTVIRREHTRPHSTHTVSIATH